MVKSDYFGKKYFYSTFTEFSLRITEFIRISFLHVPNQYINITNFITLSLIVCRRRALFKQRLKKLAQQFVC